MATPLKKRDIQHRSDEELDEDRDSSACEDENEQVKREAYLLRCAFLDTATPDNLT